MAALRKHLLREKPPWRRGNDFTMCGRAVVADVSAPDHAGRAGYAAAAVCERPDQRLAEQAATSTWRAGGPTGRGNAVLDTPEPYCRNCWLRLHEYGCRSWTQQPVSILRIDLMVADRSGEKLLSRELGAITALIAAHRAEFDEIIETQDVLSALAALPF